MSSKTQPKITDFLNSDKETKDKSLQYMSRIEELSFNKFKTRQSDRNHSLDSSKKKAWTDRKKHLNRAKMGISKF